MSGGSLINSHGGPWSNKEWGFNQHALLSATDQLLCHELDLWRYDGKTPYNRFRFVITANNEANGFAHYGFGWHLIAVNAGLALRVCDSIERLCSSQAWPQRLHTLEPPLDPPLLPRVSEEYAMSCFAGSSGKAFRMALGPLLIKAGFGISDQEVVEQIRQSSPFLNDSDFYIESLDNSRITLRSYQSVGEISTFAADQQSMAELAIAALRWIFNHEFAHCLRGHCLFVPDGFERTLYEASSFHPGFDNDLARFFELDADAVATDILIRTFSESVLDTLEKKEIWLAQALFGIGLVFLLLDSRQSSLEAYIESSHPHPFVRLQLAIHHAHATANEQLGLTVESARRCALTALRSLSTAAATLGYEAATWNLSPPEYRRAVEYQEADLSLWSSLAKDLLGNKSTFGHQRWFGCKST